MTPLGHASISFLAGIVAARLLPSLDTQTVVTPVVIGGVALDLDLLHRVWIKRTAFLDKTIGQHRFLPTHTPLFILLVCLITFLASTILANHTIFSWGLFFTFGAFIHLLLDTLFFPEGIKLLYPLNNKSFRFLYVQTYKFWAPKKISGVENWHRNYLTSPVFWISEVLPTIIAIAILLRTNLA